MPSLSTLTLLSLSVAYLYEFLPVTFVFEVVTEVLFFEELLDVFSVLDVYGLLVDASSLWLFSFSDVVLAEFVSIDDSDDTVSLFAICEETLSLPLHETIMGTMQSTIKPYKIFFIFISPKNNKCGKSHYNTIHKKCKVQLKQNTHDRSHRCLLLIKWLHCGEEEYVSD